MNIGVYTGILLYRYQTPSQVKKWDSRWLTLVCHYFSQIRWTSLPVPRFGEICCIEVMVDLLISFQVLTPFSEKNLKRKHGHTSHFKRDDISVANYLPSPDEAALLPPALLTECHAAWLHTLDYLKPLVNLIPVGTYNQPLFSVPGLFQYVADVAFPPAPHCWRFRFPVSRITHTPRRAET